LKPSSEIQDQTVRFYDEHAGEHAERTVAVDMSAIYTPFLELLPAGGMILDAGCGSGRDSKFFAEKGYKVTAIDASAAYAKEASKRTGVSVRVMRFQDLDYGAQFDGIWACASLLHVPRGQLVEVLNRFARALKPHGVFYVSVKEGTDERFDKENRYFNDMNEATFREQVEGTRSLRVRRTWLTGNRGAGTQTWLNAILGLQEP